MATEVVAIDHRGMTTEDPTPSPDLRHDAANRERSALRRAMRQSQDAEQQRRRELAGLDDAIGAAKVRAGLEAGAPAYVTKAASREEILSAISRAAGPRGVEG